MEELLGLDVPIFTPMESDLPMNDCVGIIIGGKDRYYSEQRKVPGTLFITPEWATHWRKILVGKTALKRMLADYERALVLVTLRYWKNFIPAP